MTYDIDMAPCQPITRAGRSCQWKATTQAPGALNIGGMWFRETLPPLGEICRSILEDDAEPRRIGDIRQLIATHMAIATESSQCEQFAHAYQPFMPREGDRFVESLQLLSDGGARVRRSRISITRNDPKYRWEVLDGLDRADLTAEQREIFLSLKRRRGMVGEPLEYLWIALCHLGLAPGIEERRRHYGSGFIPKLKVSDHLFQIERAPLSDQVAHCLDADCYGLVWITNASQIGTRLDLDMEALTFDNPLGAQHSLEAAHRAMMQQLNQAMGRL